MDRLLDFLFSTLTRFIITVLVVTIGYVMCIYYFNESLLEFLF